jgi:uncharacterized protein
MLPPTINMAMEDSYERLLAPSLRPISAGSQRKGGYRAIRVFDQNLYELLMSPPLGSRTVMAIDPGYRTDASWSALIRRVSSIIPPSIHAFARQAEEAGKTVTGLVEKYHIEAIAIATAPPT